VTESPQITVVIPTHNRADLLGRAIRSVLEQDVSTEIIVVDDCSSDPTPDVLATFGDSIHAVRTERNIERGAARNLGARLATSPLLAFLDSDDEWNSAKLRSQLPLAQRGLPSVTGVDFIGPTGKVLRTYKPPGGAWEGVLLQNRLLGGPSSLVIPRDLFLSVGGYPEQWSVQGSEDWLLLVKLHVAGAPMEIVREPLLRYHVHPSNSTADPQRFAVSMWSAVDLMAREGYVAEEGLARLRGHTAVVIARGFAAARSWEEAYTWLRIAVREGTPVEAGRALGLVPASALRAALRRVGV
jgi:glycosyltransferase involved in cell wall biosynthesis